MEEVGASREQISRTALSVFNRKDRVSFWRECMNEASALARMQAAAKYKPANTRVLFIAEAPPNEESRYFYFDRVFEQDWLWLGLMKGLYPSEFGESSRERLRKKY
jgi:hypothetical protein